VILTWEAAVLDKRGTCRRCGVRVDGPTTRYRAEARAEQGGAVLLRFWPIKSCCLDDPMARASWWDVAEDEIARRPGKARHIPTGQLVAALAAFVPRPTWVEASNWAREKARREARAEAGFRAFKKAFLAFRRGDLDGLPDGTVVTFTGD
jgi:hypothetical protein